jgi:two-component system sensor histidine kinase FlrB
MLPSSHVAPIDGPVTLACAAEPALADAFAAFTAAAERLEFSYQQLQAEVERLREELEERNAALTLSLAENEKMRGTLSRILEAMPCGVIVLKCGDQISFINPETRRVLTPRGNAAHVAEQIRTILGRINPAKDEEQELCITVGNSKRWLVTRCASVDESGPEAKTVLIIRDVTEQREMEREREEARRLITLAEMSSVLAHEIRNPLASMELFTGLLADSDNLSREQMSWAEHLQMGVRSLSATVNNVLRLHTSAPAPLLPLGLATALNEGVSFITPLAARTEIKLTFHEEIGDAQVSGNGSELQQVFINVALNAFRHTSPGGELLVIARRQSRAAGQVAIVEFADTGCGISAEDLPQIFEAGFSASGRTGLGLAVCQKIIQQHGGNITVESSVGTGSTFRMEFPIL